MHRNLPTNDQIQAWILGVEPYPYFERFVDRPGLLVLRAKDPPCEWRGLHIALSDARRAALAQDLLLLANGTFPRLEYRPSQPDGRPWFELYTSGVHFGSWLNLSFDLDHQCGYGDLWVRYENHSVQLRSGAASVSALASSLTDSPKRGARSHLSLRRDVKPAAASQSLWFWQWNEGVAAS